MNISHEQLVKLCNEFLQGSINDKYLQAFSERCVADGVLDSEADEVIKDTLCEWGISGKGLPITNTNVALWKERLETGVDRLAYFNDWNYHISAQRDICARSSSKWHPINQRLFIGVSSDILKDPLNGLRHPPEGSGTGWFIWSGEYSGATDFFAPHCAEHLLQIRPEVIKYLGLEPGFRFQIDSREYEDVWFDKQLLQI